MCQECGCSKPGPYRIEARASQGEAETHLHSLDGDPSHDHIHPHDHGHPISNAIFAHQPRNSRRSMPRRSRCSPRVSPRFQKSPVNWFRSLIDSRKFQMKRFQTFHIFKIFPFAYLCVPLPEPSSPQPEQFPPEATQEQPDHNVYHADYRT